MGPFIFYVIQVGGVAHYDWEGVGQDLKVVYLPGNTGANFLAKLVIFAN